LLLAEKEAQNCSFFSLFCPMVAFLPKKLALFFFVFFALFFAQGGQKARTTRCLSSVSNRETKKGKKSHLVGLFFLLSSPPSLFFGLFCLPHQLVVKSN